MDMKDSPFAQQYDLGDPFLQIKGYEGDFSSAWKAIEKKHGQLVNLYQKPPLLSFGMEKKLEGLVSDISSHFEECAEAVESLYELGKVYELFTQRTRENLNHALATERVHVQIHNQVSSELEALQKAPKKVGVDGSAMDIELKEKQAQVDRLGSMVEGKTKARESLSKQWDTYHSVGQSATTIYHRLEPQLDAAQKEFDLLKEQIPRSETA